MSISLPSIVSPKHGSRSGHFIETQLDRAWRRGETGEYWLLIRVQGDSRSDGGNQQRNAKNVSMAASSAPISKSTRSSCRSSSGPNVGGPIDMGEKVIINVKTFADGHKPPDRPIPAMV